jgi:broad specificity phosphatase PhoE
MSVTKFIFVRHGQSKANAENWIARPDTPLTELGLEQARKTGFELKNKGITKIVCSNMIRAQQTAETIAGEIGIPIDHIQIIDELHERRFPSMEGKPKTHDSLWYFNTDEGDSEQKIDLIKRMKKALQKIQKLAARDLVLVVAHGCSGFYMLEIASGKNHFDDFREVQLMNNADFIEVNFS